MVLLKPFHYAMPYVEYEILDVEITAMKVQSIS